MKLTEMFGKVLSVEREFVGVRIVENGEGCSYKVYTHPTDLDSSRILDIFGDIPDSASPGFLKVLYNRNFLLFGISVRNTSSQFFLPSRKYSFSVFVYETMQDRRLE